MYTYMQNEFFACFTKLSTVYDIRLFIGHSNRLLRDPNLEIALLLSSPKCDDTR